MIDSMEKLTGPQKAAVLMLSLSEEYASKVVQKLAEYEIMELSMVMANLGKVSSDVVENVYEQFVEGVYTGTELVGTYESAERILTKIMSKEKVDIIMEEIRGPAGRTMWDKLGNVSEETLAGYLKNEYPQTVTVVLSKIKTSHAAKVLALLPESLAADVMVRLLQIDAVQKEVLTDIEHTLKTEFMTNLNRSSAKNSFEKLAEMFNSLDRQTEERYMRMLEEKNPDAAEKVKSLMFTFEDLLKLDPSGVQNVIKNVDKSQLALALKGAKDQIKELFFSNMSERAAKLLKEDMEAMGMVKLKVVDEAQQNVVTTTKALVDRGEVSLSEDEGDIEMIG